MRRRGAAQLADFDDLAVLDADIAAERRHPGAIDNQPVLDQQIIRHRIPLGLPLNRNPAGECSASGGVQTHPADGSSHDENAGVPTIK